MTGLGLRVHYDTVFSAVQQVTCNVPTLITINRLRRKLHKMSH